MTDREKLVELLEAAESAVYWNSSDKNFIEKIADHLIAHGVTVREMQKYTSLSIWASISWGAEIFPSATQVAQT